MKTRRLVSTISYNTENGLAAILERLKASEVIDWAHWVHHDPEEDEKKDHFHVIMSPSRTLDTVGLQKEFLEVDTTCLKPLGVLPFQVSRFDDWFLYGIHDIGYLASKGQSRKHHYTLQDVRSTCEEFLHDQAKQVNNFKYRTFATLQEFASDRKPWTDVLLSGVVPVPQWRYWQEVYFAMTGVSLRGGRSGHDSQN